MSISTTNQPALPTEEERKRIKRALQVTSLSERLARLFTLRFYALERFPARLQSLDDQQIETMDAGMFYMVSAVTNQLQFGYCLECPSDAHQPTEHEEPLRLIILSLSNPEALDDERRMTASFVRSGIHRDSTLFQLVGHGNVHWSDLIEYSPTKDLMPWIEAATKEIENWESLIHTTELEKRPSKLSSLLQELAKEIDERASFSPEGGLVRLTELFADLMIKQLKQARVTMDRASVTLLVNEILRNKEP